MSDKNYTFDVQFRERTLMMKFRKFHRKIEHILQHRLRGTELYASESRLLRIISLNSGLTQRELAAKTNSSPASTGVILKKLEQKDFITRKESPKDSRANSIFLTAKGENFMEYVHELHYHLDLDIFSNLTDEEITSITTILDKLTDNANKFLEENG